MSLEMTKNRMKNLASFYGKIGIEEEEGEQIVVRITFGDRPTAERVYDNLFKIEDGSRCMDCGRYIPTLIGGLCEECWNKEV